MTYQCQELERYVDLLRKADILYRSAERTKPGKRPRVRDKAVLPSHWRSLDSRALGFRMAEKAYERALEFLDDAWPSVAHLLDRPFNGWRESDVTAEPSGVPRFIGSKSRFVRR